MTESQDFLSNALDQATHAAERRSHQRQAVPSLAYVQLDEGNGGIILNISEGGIAVQAAMSLMDQTLPLVRFQLTPSKEWIEAPAEVAWTGETRKMAGLRFVNASPLASRQIKEWIKRENGVAEFAEAELVEDDLSARALAAIAELPGEVPDEDPELRDDSARAPEDETGNPAPPLFNANFNDELANGELVSTEFVGDELNREAEAIEKRVSSKLPFAVRPREIRSAASAAAAPYRFGRMFEQPPESSFDLPQSHPRSYPQSQLLSNEFPADRSLSQNPNMLIALLVVVALVSLTVGWMSGPALFRGAFERKSEAAKGQAATTVPQGPDAEASRVSNIEVIDNNQQRWLIPFDAPAGESGKNAAHVPRNQTLFQAGALAAPIQPPTDDAARKLESPPADAAPTINAPPINTPTGAQSVMPESGIAGARTAMSPPQAPRNTQPTQQAARQVSQQTPRAPVQQSQQAPQAEQAEQAPPGQGVLKPGVLIRRVEPFYPAEAQQKQIEGVVRLRAMVGPEGDVRSVEVESGPAMLVDSAEDAVRQWRYTPTLLDGKPIDSIYNVTIDFRLPHR